MVVKVGNDYINSALYNLVDMLGISEPVEENIYVTLVEKRDYNECIEMIAKQYGLNCKFNIKIVPKGYKKGKSYYKTTGLVETHEDKKSPSITAQIIIPGNLPMYGDPKFKNVTLDVLVEEVCSEYPEAFIAIMAHEAAHLLLAALQHPQSENEVYADLIPLILGFGDIVRTGRKSEKVIDEKYDPYLNKTVKSIETTTYGYLNKEQFYFAYNRTNEILWSFKEQIIKVIDISDELADKICEIKDAIKKFEVLLSDVAKHGKKNISFENGSAIVEFHKTGYLDEFFIKIKSSEIIQKKAIKNYGNVMHYNKKTIENLDGARRELVTAQNKLNIALSDINGNIDILQNNLRVGHKLATLLRSFLRKG